MWPHPFAGISYALQHNRPIEGSYAKAETGAKQMLRVAGVIVD